MGTNLFTLIAQIINFLLLVALLKHFLYGRIVKAMDDREKAIASTVKEASDRRAEAEAEAQALRRKQQELEAGREEALARARQDAEAERKGLIQAARREADESRGRWKKALEQQRTSFLADLRTQVGRGAVAVARRALADLADEELEGRIVEGFLRRTGRLPEEDRRAVRQSIEEAREPVVVSSAFEVPEGARARIAEAVGALAGGEVELRFETEPDLISGIELRADSRKVAWSIDDYLKGLEEELVASLEEQAAEETAPEPQRAAEAALKSREVEEKSAPEPEPVAEETAPEAEEGEDA